MVDEKQQFNQRQHPRAPIGVIVQVNQAGSSQNYFSKNISAGGAFLLAEKPIEVDTRLSILLYLPKIERPVKAEAEVVWIQRQAPTGFAIRFTKITDAGRELIRWAVDRYLNQKDNGAKT
jgi:PilZ domain.